MKKGVIIILVLSMFLNVFSSVKIFRYDENGNLQSNLKISDRKGNEVYVNILSLEKKEAYFGEMFVKKDDDSVDRYISYSYDYDFYTGKWSYYKYEKPILYNTFKYGSIAIASGIGFVIALPVQVASLVGLSVAAVSGVAVTSSGLLAEKVIDKIFDNYDEEKWYKVETTNELNGNNKTLEEERLYYKELSEDYSNKMKGILENDYDISYLDNDNRVLKSNNIKKEIQNYPVALYDMDKLLYLINEYISIQKYNLFYSDEKISEEYINDFLNERYGKDEKIYNQYFEPYVISRNQSELDLILINNFLIENNYKGNKIADYLPNLFEDKKIAFKNNLEIMKSFKEKAVFINQILKQIQDNPDDFVGISDKEIKKLYKFTNYFEKYVEAKSKQLRIELVDIPLNLYFTKTYHYLMNVEKKDEKTLENLYSNFSDLAYIYAHGAISDITNSYSDEIIKKFKDLSKNDIQYQDLKTFAEKSPDKYKFEVEKLFEDWELK
ncbi:hypothetical protein [Geotoga petraea]|uniref:Uncharacterized protein n=1 Tax=Geotoga petraea TaxID=28234 RepID=A0A4Z0W168_9BACT|nr:hypothetical protein [Geotoga petraea]TGG86965.1 hypothetical protein E4650_08895 [Geotoga petraea]